MYKVSKFTFSCINSKNELLLYNTFNGTESFCKFKDIKFLSIFKENSDINLNSNICGQLLEKGIIVEEDTDENKKLYCQFIEVVNQNKLVLFINPTEKCNFRCKYCYESFEHGKMSRENQDKIIKFVRENIYKYSGLHIAWFGGEPLLALDCIEYLSENLLKICNFNKRRYEASMTTNGYLLNHRTFNRLLNYKIKQFQITIDGTKEIHNKYRLMCNGSDTYEIILQNLMDIKALKRRDFSIILRSNMTKEIFLKLDEYLQDLESLCLKDTRFHVAIFKAGNWLEKAKAEIIEDLLENANDLKLVYEEILKSNRKINISTLFLNLGSGLCYAGKFNNYLVCADGSLHKCTVTFEDPATEVGTMESGRIIKNNNYYSMISKFDSCKNFYSCFNAPICMGKACPIKPKANTNCSYHKECLDIILKIFDKQNSFPIISEII